MMQGIKRIVAVCAVWGMGGGIGGGMVWCGSAVAGVASVGVEQSRPDAARQITVLSFESAGAAAVLVDPKDAALRQAFAMLPMRLAELGRELPDVPPQAMALAPRVLDMMSRPARFAVVYDGDNPSGGAFGYGAILSLEMPSEQAASAMHGEVSAMMLAAGDRIRPKASTRFQGMTDISVQLAIVSYGPRQSNGAWRYEIIAGTMNNPDAPFAGLEDGAVMRVAFDSSGLAPLAEMLPMLPNQDPQTMQRVAAMLEQSGLIGEDPLRFESSWRYTATESIVRTTMRGAMVAGPWSPRGTLTTADFAAIPADAHMACVGKFDLSWLRGMAGEAAEMGAPVEDALAEFEARTGVNIFDDVIDALGGTAAMYLSDSTGGGSLASGVAMVTFKDRARFISAFEKLRAMANTLADAIPVGPGYVRLAAWEYDGIDLISLRFNGLPVPLELTWAMTDRWLIAGAMPQSVIAAVRQAGGKAGEGLMANAAFAAAMPRGREVTSVSFLETQRAMRAGYPLVSMFGSAVSNAMRSPSDASRGPAMVVPTFGELRQGARAMIEYSYWEGDVLITESRGDRSVLVNAAASLGAMEPFLPLIAIPAAIGAQQGGGMQRGW